MERKPSTNAPIVVLMHFKIFNSIIKIHNILSNGCTFVKAFSKSIYTKWNLIWRSKKLHNYQQLDSKDQYYINSNLYNSDLFLNEQKICMSELDLNVVMDRLGITWEEEENTGTYDLLTLLDEKPSLEEVKQVFDMFDEDKTGFIDAFELQRVLCSLGIKEGCDLEKCRRMVNAFDDNGDGVIDFSEFANFMEKSFMHIPS